MKFSKKSLIFIMAVAIMITMLALSFADTAKLSSTLSSNDVKVGDTITMTVTLDSVVADSLGVTVNVSDNFEVVSGEWLQSGLMADYNVERQKGVFMPAKSGNISGDIFKITLKAKTANSNNQNISITLTAKQSVNVVLSETTTQSVKINCSTHSFGSYNKTNTEHSRTCASCGYVEKSAHKWDSGKITAAATCTKEGTKTYTCTTCSHTKTETIKKLNHTYGKWTNVDANNHSKTCSCGDTVTAKHTWDNGKVTTAATCSKEGVKTYTCSGCGATKTEAVTKTAHAYSNACDTSCNNCGEIRVTSHNYESKWSSDAKNHWHECSVCKDAKDKATHTSSDWIIDKEATDLKAGSKHKECTVCKKTISTETIPATGCKHTSGTKVINKKDVTCDADGYTGDEVCKACETVITKGEVVKSAGHKIELQNAKDATCKEDGYTGDEVCIICNNTIKPGEVIAKGEHTIEITDAKEATCTEDGFTGKSTCTTCGELIDEGTTIGKLNHKFVDGACTMCNEKDPHYTPSTTPTEPTPIDDDNNSNVWLFVGIGAGVLVIALIIIFIILKRKREDDSN